MNISCECGLKQEIQQFDWNHFMQVINAGELIEQMKMTQE